MSTERDYTIYPGAKCAFCSWDPATCSVKCTPALRSLLLASSQSPTSSSSGGDAPPFKTHFMRKSSDSRHDSTVLRSYSSCQRCAEVVHAEVKRQEQKRLLLDDVRKATASGGRFSPRCRSRIHP